MQAQGFESRRLWVRACGSRQSMGGLGSRCAGSDVHGGAHAADIAEHAQINGRPRTGCRWPFPDCPASLTAGRPSTDVTLQTIEIGSSTLDASGAQPTKSLVRLVPQPKLTRTRPAKWRWVSSIETDIHAVGENQELLAGIAALLLPPFDDVLAGRDRRRAVGPKAGPVRDPIGRVAQKRFGAKASGRAISRLPP